MVSATQYAVIALIFFGLGDFVFKRAADSGTAAHHFLVWQVVFFAPCVLLISYFTGVLVWDPFALWGCLAGLFIFIGLYSFSRSLAGGAVSINGPLFRMNFVVTALLAIFFLQEPLTPNKMLGLLSALAAVWFLAGGSLQRAAFDAPQQRRSLGRALIATGALGAGNFCHKVGLSHGVPPFAMLSAQVVVFANLAWLSSVAIDRGIKVKLSSWRYGFAAATLLLVAFVSMLQGFVLGEASVVAPIAQMGFLVTAALGIFVLGERFTARKAIGLAAAAVALAAFMF